GRRAREAFAESLAPGRVRRDRDAMAELDKLAHEQQIKHLHATDLLVQAILQKAGRQKEDGARVVHRRSGSEGRECAGINYTVRPRFGGLHSTIDCSAGRRAATIDESITHAKRSHTLLGNG